jgi:6-pyruvoyltetrahydropterin/6-carboxytetrahydropterin synthase
MFLVTKTYGHELGLSACFRQWRAVSHCRFLHGYALSFKFVFEAQSLDDKNWVIDFGGLDELKQKLKDVFDHRLIVADDDPQMDTLSMLNGLGCANVLILPDVGCEMFARYAWGFADDAVRRMGVAQRVRVISCEVREHGANSAIYIAPQDMFGRV